MEHLSQEQLEALVMGTAYADDAAVRRHLATCEACARRLVREAQLESELYDAAGVVAGEAVTARAHPTPAPRWRVALSVAAALALVTVGTWSLVSRKNPEVSPPRATTVGGRSTNAPGATGPRITSRKAHEVPLQDVCRCVTVERSQGPPTDPGDSRLCTPPSAP